MIVKFQQYIDGQWLDALNGNTWDVINPATEEKIATVPFGNAVDARRALDAAQKAQSAWAERTVYERAAILKKAADLVRERADELAPIMTQECGKPLSESRGEWVVTGDLLEWFAEEGKRAYGRTIPNRRAGKRLMVVYHPIGVIASITAWNFPAWLLGRVWGAALVAGCAVVARPSELTPMSAMVLTNILEEAGLPPGVLNLVNGEPDSIGKEFLTNPICRKISFTGSVRVGRLLMRRAAENLTRLSLELGGNAPVIVFPDTDIESAVKQSIFSKFRNNGQVCVAPQRFYVHKDVYEDFLDRTAALTRDLKVGNGLETGVNVGPLISAVHRERVEALVSEAISDGALAVTGGSRLAGSGYFYPPTVLTNIRLESRIAREEIFGPVLPIMPFRDTTEALELANASDYGLAAYVFTNNLNTTLKMYEGLEYGIIGINDLLPTATEAPFGGFKQSGLGREQGHEGLMNFLETKFVSIGGL
ncbi:MAG: NAD-dependent succinate-semialdehyde dehydrogenase [Chloroflexota bacterium]